MSAGKTIIFDWNGTLLADTQACIRATNKVLAMLDVPRISLAKYRKHYTMPLDRLYHAIGCDPKMLAAREHEVHPLWHATYDAGALRLRRGAKPMLKSVRAAGHESIILSNYVTQKIDTQARKLGIRDHFREIIAFEARDSTFRRRGKGDRLKDYIRGKRVSGGIIVGDSEEEIEIGRALGLVTVAVLDGMCSAQRLRAMKPDFLVRNLNRIPAIAAKVFGTMGRTS
jgi:phosphoglycolate phosphatase-like HAD superfamily hydrolase